MGVGVGHGLLEQFASQATSLAIRHRSQQRQDPIAFAHERLGQTRDGSTIVRHPRPSRVGGEEVTDAILKSELVRSGHW
jgi:hypothetical protein